MTNISEGWSDPTRPTVGVIGLGDIGAGVATSLASAGLPLVVCDLRTDITESFASRGVVAPSPGGLGDSSDIVVVAVVNDAQVRSVLLGPSGALKAMSPGDVVVIVSTISPATVVEVVEAAEALDIGIVDCGVSGGPAAAASGELIAMVGGDPTVIEKVAPALDAFSSLVVRMGGTGTGLIAKLARNVVQYGGWLAAYEGQVLAEAAGIELSKLAEVIRASDAKIGGAATLMFRPTVAPFGPDDHEGLVSAMQTAAALAHKDLLAALEVAGELGIDLPLVAQVEQRADWIFGVSERGTD